MPTCHRKRSRRGGERGTEYRDFSGGAFKRMVKNEERGENLLAARKEDRHEKNLLLRYVGLGTLGGKRVARKKRKRNLDRGTPQGVVGNRGAVSEFVHVAQGG